MMELMEEKGVYLADYARLERDLSKVLPFVHDARQQAIERFEELGFPSVRHEEWRFTNLAPLTRMAFGPAVPVALSAESIRPHLVANAHTLVFVNGCFAPDLSAVGKLPSGTRVGSLSSTGGQTAWMEPHLAKHASYEDHAFIALNTAFFRDGASIYIPNGTIVREPIHLLFVSVPGGSQQEGREAGAAHPRTLAVVGVDSQVTLVESYIGLEEGVYFTNAVTEVVAGENATIDHYKLQQESRNAFHVATLQVNQSRASSFSSHFISFGGALVRNEVNAVLDAEGCECILNGLYLADGRQHIDNHTVIDHAKPRCASHELYKGIIGGQAKGVFNGKIFVRPDAQKTDAKQTNQTLLLSEDATINTKPQLEIYADDVKCTHGATVGQIDEEALFYLRSRGIDAQAARGLLTYAFANDIVTRIKIDGIRTRLEETLLASQRLPAAAGALEAL